MIPQVAAGSTARTVSSPTSCTSSVKEAVDSNSPASSDSAELSKGAIASGIRVNLTHRHKTMPA